jgi:glycosyltransferase involved in cell wall biosynthesis
VNVVITVGWAARLGGGETMLTDFLRSIDHSRLRALVVFFEPGPLVEEVASTGARTAVIPGGRLRNVRATTRVVRLLAQLLRRERPDVVLNWTPKTHIYGALAALVARRGDRVAWWQHTIVPRTRLLDRVAGLLPARAVVCSSRSTAAVQRTRWPARRTFVVHPGIELPVRTQEPERSALRERLEIPSARRVVGLVGRLEPGKRHDRFLDVIALLRREGLDVHGLIVGGLTPGSPPELASRLEDGIAVRGLGDVMTWTGQVPDAGPYIDLMDVLVSVASVESFGIALVEAMARGVPVVAAAAGGPEEIIESGTSGLIVPTADPVELAEAVASVLARPTLRRRLVAGGSERVRTRFTRERMTRDIERALEEVCAS